MIHNTAVLTLSEGWRKQSSALKICGAVSKEKGFGNYFPKPNLVGVTGFEPAASTSQTSRATSCATPRSVKNIEFLSFFRKWSNMWSNRFYRGFCERVKCRKSQCLQGLSAFFVFSESVVGVLLPNVARYQLRHTPKCEKY